MTQPTSLHDAAFSVPTLFHAPSPGTTLEDVLAPEYWAHVAATLRAGARIELLAQDGAWWAMLLVRAAGKTDAKVQALQYVELGQREAVTVGGYEVKWRGPARKWGIVRTSDLSVLQDGFAVKEEAADWMAGHLATLAA